MERRFTAKRTLAGKRRCRRQIVAPAGTPKSNKDRIWIYDHDGGEHHLVDMGAEVSIKMASTLDRQRGLQGMPLSAANGSSITTYGEQTMSI